MYIIMGATMEINAAEFRTRCFKILDEVQTTHKQVIITKRGKPIARIVHIQEQDRKDPLLGVLIGAGRTVGDLTQPIVDSQEWEMD